MSEEDFLAGLDPAASPNNPSDVKGPSANTAAHGAAPAAASGSRLRPSGIFNQCKPAGTDATSTLLNFLKQEQAIVSSASKASQPHEQGLADRPNTGPLPVGQVRATGQQSTEAADKSGWSAPVKQQQQQRASAGMGAARAQHQHSAPTVKAAASGAGRLDSWDLDDDALPNGSFSTQQGPAPAVTAGSHVSGYNQSSSNWEGRNFKPLTADTTAAAPSGQAATGSGLGNSNSISSRPVKQPHGVAASPSVGKDDAERQQVVLQMAAALERRAQLQQQQPQQQKPPMQQQQLQMQQHYSASNSSDSSPVPSFFTSRQAEAATSPAAAALSTPVAGSAASAAGSGSDSFGLSTPAGSPNKLSPLAAPSVGYSSRSSSVNRTFGTAAAATAAAAATETAAQPAGLRPAAASFASGTAAAAAGGAAAAVGNTSGGGLGGLLARGLADFGISESDLEATPAVASASAARSSNLAAAGGSGVPAGVSVLRPLSTPVTLSSSAAQQFAHPSMGPLPPGVSPIAGRRSPLQAAAQADAAPAQAAPAAAEPVQQHPAAVQPAAAAAVALPNSGGAGGSAAAAAALLSNITSSPAAWSRHNSAAGTLQAPSQQQSQPPPHQQMQQQPQPAQHQAAVAANSGGSDFDGQLAAMRQLSQMQGDLADQKSSLARLRQQAEEDHAWHQAEVGRLRSELDAAHQKAAADMATVRQEAAEQVAAAEARARKELELQRSVLSAQLSAQAAAIQQEREALISQRINTDMLASLLEQVRGAASVTAEREARALAALEKGSAERAAAVASRERVLAECEEKVASREVELEGLKAHLTRLLSGLDAHREAEQQVLAGHTARLSKEAARLEALQAALLSEREETKLALVMEKQALEEARTARIKEREAFIAEVVAERRRLAEENAAAARSAEEARANLLDLKTRVAQYEAQAAAALRQAHEVEAKATTSKEAAAKERATLDELKKELQAATCKLDEDRRQLQEWGERLVALTKEFDEARQEVKAARKEIEGQRTLLAQQGAALSSAQDRLEGQRQDLLAARLELDRQRVEVADARAALSKERIAASKAATDAALMVATTAAHGTIGLDTPTAWGPATAAKRPFPAGRVWPSASVPHSVSSGAVGAAAAAARRCNSSMGGASSKAGRKLRRIVDKLQHDQGRGKRVSSAVQSQQDFLTLLRSTSPVSCISGSTHNHKAAQSTMLVPPTASLAPAAPGSPTPVVLYPFSSTSSPQQQRKLNSLPAGWQPTLAGQGLGSVFLSAGTCPAHASAMQGTSAADSNAAVMLLQQLAQLQHLVSQQQQPAGKVQDQQPTQVPATGSARKHSSNLASGKDAAASAGAGSASGLLAGFAKGKLQQLAKHLQQQRKMQQHSAARAGSCGISRVSSDLTQLLTLSVSGSSEDSEAAAEDGVSVGGDEKICGV